MLDEKVSTLRNNIRAMERAVIAFSGGIDSTLVAKIAAQELGQNAVALTAVSASLPQAELEECKALAVDMGLRHILIESHEVELEAYQQNTPTRCYFCKTVAYDLFTDYAQHHNFPFILDGTNADDVGDHRPGRKAALEHGVRSPLQEANFNKAEIRLLAQQLGLPNWNKPAAACLSSRIPYGSRVTVEALNQIEQAEAVLKRLGLGQLRVRHHDNIARIEIPPEDFAALLEHRDEIINALTDLGYLYITLDLAGFRSGSMNDVLKPNKVTHGYHSAPITFVER